MKPNGVLAVLAGFGLGLTPAMALAESVNISRSIFTNQPYTLIYPDTMVASGGIDGPIIINHPNAPLQCELSVVPVDDDGWSAETALGALDEEEVAAAWSDTLPGFTLGAKGTAAYQDAKALLYEGTSKDSAMGMPLTLVHTETVSEGRGYALDCLFATEASQQARPVVDFIIANFSTHADAECCVGVDVVEPATEPPTQ